MNQDNTQESSSINSIHKDTVGKPRADLLIEYFPRALMEVAKVCDFGAKKYGEFTWDKVSSRAYKGALARHLLQAEGALIPDDETGLPHYAAVAWNALAVLELELRASKSFIRRLDENDYLLSVSPSKVK